MVYQKFLFAAGELAQDKPVVVSKFILNAKEIEFDGVAHDGKILNYAISEHVEVCLTIEDCGAWGTGGWLLDRLWKLLLLVAVGW